MLKAKYSKLKMAITGLTMPKHTLQTGILSSWMAIYARIL